MEITYSKYGDYYLPNLILSEEEPATYGRYDVGRAMNNIRNAVEKTILNQLIYNQLLRIMI